MQIRNGQVHKLNRIKNEIESLAKYSSWYYENNFIEIEKNFTQGVNPSEFSLLIFLMVLCEQQRYTETLGVINFYLIYQSVSYQELLSYLAATLTTGDTQEYWLKKAEEFARAATNTPENIFLKYEINKFPLPFPVIAIKTFLCLGTLGLIHQLNAYIINQNIHAINHLNAINADKYSLEKLARSWLNDPLNNQWGLALSIQEHIKLATVLHKTEYISDNLNEISPENWPNQLVANSGDRLLHFANLLTKTSLTILQTGVDKENPAAEFSMANHYICTTTDKRAFAFNLLIKSATQYYPAAQALLGLLILHNRLSPLFSKDLTLKNLFDEIHKKNPDLINWVNTSDKFLDSYGFKDAVSFIQKAVYFLPYLHNFLIDLNKIVKQQQIPNFMNWEPVLVKSRKRKLGKDIYSEPEKLKIPNQDHTTTLGI